MEFKLTNLIKNSCLSSKEKHSGKETASIRIGQIRSQRAIRTLDDHLIRVSSCRDYRDYNKTRGNHV